MSVERGGQAVEVSGHVSDDIEAMLEDGEHEVSQGDTDYELALWHTPVIPENSGPMWAAQTLPAVGYGNGSVVKGWQYNMRTQHPHVS